MRRGALAVFALGAALGGCGRPLPDGTAGNESPPPLPAVRAAPPVDHLADGELLEGPAVAFGMHLPRKVDVEGAFADQVVASGPVGLHPFVEYLKARFQGGDLREGERSATFEHVRVAAKPGPELRVHLGISPEGVRVELCDMTPPVIAPASDEETRWRRVGLTPDGRLADPMHMD